MKHIGVCFLCMLFYTSISFSQGEASIWYFGFNAGLDFSSGSPVALLDGQVNTSEGCATISNSDGDLLFYTDGIIVWDKNHNIMPNGTGLLGNPSSTQSGIIVPKPGNADLYYIFTVGNEANPDGLRYSEVDLSLNGGNGDVTESKNILLITPSTEKITAIEHTNGNDFWVIAHGWNSNDFLAYAVTDSGVNTTPVTSSVGTVHTGGPASTIGYMKISPNGERLALASYSSDSYVELFDFDTSSGSVSNPIRLDNIFIEGEVHGTYGVEFSPNNDLLYISDTDGIAFSSKVHQFDITFDNANDIINSDTILYEGNNFVAAIQLAIDGKLYLANGNSAFLDVIENPDILGPGANYLSNAIDLNGRISVFGLPPFIQSFFNVGIMVEDTCFGSETLFSVDANENIVSIEWDFGDGNTSDIINPTHTYASPGTYIVTVIVNSEEDSRTLEREIIIYEVPIAQTVTDYDICDDDINDGISFFDLTVKADEIRGTQSNETFDVAFYISLNNAELDQDRVSLNYQNLENNQELFARIYNTGNPKCYDITSFTLIVYPSPVAHPITDLVFCDDEINDGVAPLGIRQFDDFIFQDQSPEDFAITYHLTQEDADNGNASLPDDFQNLTNPQFLFVRIEYILAPFCFDTTSFSVTIDGQIVAYQPETLFTCDDPSNDGFETFNLSLQEEQIINGQEGDFNITYYNSEEDALSGENSISETYTNITNPQMIFARIEDSDNDFCFDITQFQIAVLETPAIIENETTYICTNETTTLFAEQGFDTYLWSTGAITSSIIVNEPGIYTVEVTQNHQTQPPQSCTNIKTITVIESDEAMITNIEIDDWSARDNTITVLVEGLGDYEYSIDGINYTDFNFFNNLRPGEYTVYVRDKNNCGIVSQVVFLLHYPNFFTPNNDGFNDYWQIILSETDPTLEIYIYDRYGKMMTVLSPSSIGWDGMYNGHLMPSNDYWFRVVRPSIGEIYKGHFTLKR